MSKIKIVDKVTPNLTLLQTNIQSAMAMGVADSLDRSTRAMQRRVVSAVTKTGRNRVAGIKPRFKVRPAWYAGRGPGRIESGDMYNSIRWTMTETTGSIRARGGFINAPRYTALQELGDQKVPAMLAFSMGNTLMQARFPISMKGFADRAVRNAQLGRTLPRRGI